MRSCRWILVTPKSDRYIISNKTPGPFYKELRELYRIAVVGMLLILPGYEFFNMEHLNKSLA
jgi:hypothetical protein